jgi:hypothetical protein
MNVIVPTPELRCATCGRAVIQGSTGFLRACDHRDAAVIAEISATMHGAGGLTAG